MAASVACPRCGLTQIARPTCKACGAVLGDAIPPSNATHPLAGPQSISPASSRPPTTKMPADGSSRLPHFGLGLIGAGLVTFFIGDLFEGPVLPLCILAHMGLCGIGLGCYATAKGRATRWSLAALFPLIGPVVGVIVLAVTRPFPGQAEVRHSSQPPPPPASAHSPHQAVPTRKVSLWHPASWEPTAALSLLIGVVSWPLAFLLVDLLLPPPCELKGPTGDPPLGWLMGPGLVPFAAVVLGGGGTVSHQAISRTIQWPRGGKHRDSLGTHWAPHDGSIARPPNRASPRRPTYGITDAPPRGARVSGTVPRRGL